MKRSKFINLQRMKKNSSNNLKLATTIIAVSVTTSGCSKQEGYVFQSAKECDNTLNDSRTCQLAYKEALRKAKETAPKYSTQNQCEYEFGNNACESFDSYHGYSNYSNSGSYKRHRPKMRGYALAQAKSGKYKSAPLFTSDKASSYFHRSWVGANGKIVGKRGSKRLGMQMIPNDVFKAKATSKTTPRGGFGKTVRTTSSWGG